mmetsp:Transcript_27128/g.84392  ORF Transcript_27128/g.84392 Transcript_27128/m.84392 type:complete len:176 (+) Transcript_27128:187-714(+)
MKPTWDRLMTEYKDSPSILIASVDCTSPAGKPKCQEVGIRGYPTIKHGDPHDLQDYQGGRGWKELSAFAEGLQPTCSPVNMHLCDEEKQKLIKELQALPLAERDALIKEKEGAIEELQANFTTLVEALTQEHRALQEEKEKTIRAAKAKGLTLLKSVHRLEERKMEKRGGIEVEL